MSDPNIKPALNPEDFIITRKRKQYRFAMFYNAKNCFELAEWKPIKSKNVVIEVGSGTGIFLVELAKRNPSLQFIALDVKADRLQKGARQALDLGVSNIYFVRARADQLLEVVAPRTVQTIWLTFSDPFPKKRDAKKRLTHESYLNIYKKAHVDKKARLLIKTDSRTLFDWSLEQLVADGWRFNELTYDLHESPFDSSYKIMTLYEKKWTDEGLPIYFASASR